MSLSYPLSQGFTTTFGFLDPTIDPFRIARTFTAEILEYHILGHENLISSLQRASAVLDDTPVCFIWNLRIYVMQSATLRTKPNGKSISCCGRQSEYVNQNNEKTACKFRCRSKDHKGERRFWITLLKTEAPVRWVVDHGQKRFLISLHPNDQLKDGGTLEPK